MMSKVMIWGAASPVDHVLPHRLHERPLLTIPVGGPDWNNDFLSIRDGHYSFYITNHLMMTAVAAVVVIGVFWWVSRRVRVHGQGAEAVQTKGRVAQLFETMCVFIRDEVARPNLGHLTDRYIPYIWTVFFFILFANLLGLIPIGYLLQLVTGNAHFSHWGGTATGNLSLNVGLALVSLTAIIGIGIRESGAKQFFGHFNPVGWERHMLPIGLGLFVLEWMGLLIKCVVLAMRLFGTMMAGHLVIAAFVLLIFSAGRHRRAGDGGALDPVGNVYLLLASIYFHLPHRVVHLRRGGP
jgi:F-type H+-transporting ATPase subunit a